MVGPAVIHHGDCLVKLRELEDNSVDAIVTDPPYGISFMAKKWDYDVPSVDVWRECLRVLKPGGHMLVACGTRTQHRMVVNIEDAGFEIRDVVTWLYGQGFPKAVDCAKQAIKEGIACDCKSHTEHPMRFLSDGDLSSSIHAANEPREVLQPCLSEQEPSESGATRSESESCQGKESCLEGRTVCGTGEGLCDGSLSGSSKSTAQRICTGTHSSSREDARKAIDGDGSGAPHQPRQNGQSPREFEGVSGSQRALDGSPFPRCSGCERPILPEGWKSALKPACEFWTLCRKPLSESTVAKNVLKWGTGGINVDGCRVGTEPAFVNRLGVKSSGGLLNNTGEHRVTSGGSGRFPANLILDEEAAQALDAQTGVLKSGSGDKGNRHGVKGVFGRSRADGFNAHYEADSGGASRFFYVAKASKSDRGQGNTHPTVKPTSLMAYLCRLVTPPGGLVLDPFAGSGSTGVGALRESFRFIGIEREEQYVTIAKERIENELSF